MTGLDPLDGELRQLEVSTEVDGAESVPLQQELPGRLGDCKIGSVTACTYRILHGFTKRWAQGCVKFLPGPAWLLLSKTGPPFSASLYG